jgi:hypothetical protein
MILNTFANLHLHDTQALLDSRQAQSHVIQPSVMVPATKFFTALCSLAGKTLGEGHVGALVNAFGVAKFNTCWDDGFGPRGRTESATIDAAHQVVAAVCQILKECGTAPESDFKPLKPETLSRFVVTAGLYCTVFTATHAEIRDVLIDSLEIALHGLYGLLAKSQEEGLIARIRASVVRTEEVYARMNLQRGTDGILAEIRASHGF